MDPALSRLSIVGGRDDCPDSGPLSWCRNQESYERLVSQLGVSIAPSLHAPARSVGSRGLSLSLGMTITSIDANAGYWRKGSEGSASDAAGGANTSPDPALVWTRATLSKGLPFGFEVGASAGKGYATSLWSLGLSIKWAIIEGFRTGIGALPDVAIAASTTRSMGLDEVSLAAHSMDLLLSKPFHTGQGFVLSPLLGLQLLFIEAHSAPVDLTPGPPALSTRPVSTEDVDAFAACRPTPDRTTRSAPLLCSGTGDDFVNNVHFDAVSQTRLRLFVGGQAQHGMWRFSASLGFDLLTPKLAAERVTPIQTTRVLGRQVALALAAGIAL